MLDTRDFTLTPACTFEAAAASAATAGRTRASAFFDVSMVEYTAGNAGIQAQMYQAAPSPSAAGGPRGPGGDLQAANDLLTIRRGGQLRGCAGERVASARSLGAVNVRVIMESLGGGGHQTMAAAQLGISPRRRRSRIPDGHRPHLGGPEKERPRSGSEQKKRINGNETVRLSYRWRWPVRRGICP